MELTRQNPAGRQLIQRYQAGQFKVSDTLYNGSVIVLPTATTPWAVASFDQLTVEAFAPLRGVTLDVCLLGCGARMQRLPADLRNALKEQGLVVEPMDTGGACRTYNMLISEGRLVAAALIAL